MAFGLKKIRSNTLASGTGVMLVLVPFVISVFLTGVFVPTGDGADIGGLSLFVPENYQNMSESERADFLAELHGGYPNKDWRPELRWWYFIPAGFGIVHYVYPDGTDMSSSEYHKYIEGDADKPDYWQVASNMITINPPALHSIGVYGGLVRIIMIASVCIGLVDLLWFG